jgi:hypothetical protein
MGILGFTGSRDGMTIDQRFVIQGILIELEPDQTVHGDCTGADAAFDVLCKELDIFREAYPGKDRYGRSPTRAFCDCQIIHPPLPYLVRDKIIAEKSDLGLIACPKGMIEERRSGTWTTVRYARNLNRRVWLVYPDGSLTIER